MYLPALAMLEKVLNDHPSAFTNVMFFSDGKPSDDPPNKDDATQEAWLFALETSGAKIADPLMKAAFDTMKAHPNIPKKGKRKFVNFAKNNMNMDYDDAFLTKLWGHFLEVTLPAAAAACGGARATDGERRILSTMRLVARHTIKAVSNQSPATFRFQTIGLGASGSDFQTLEAMAGSVNGHFGSSVAEFHMCSLSQRVLTSAMASFSSTVTESILTVTNTNPAREQRQLRTVVKSAADIAWQSHRQVRSYMSPKSLGATFEPMKGRFDVMISETPFDEGGERYVYNFSRVDSNGKRTAEKWIAKKNKHIEFGTKELDFHRLNMVTQYISGELAEKFGLDVTRAYGIVVDQSARRSQQYMKGPCSQCNSQTPPLHTDPADGNIYCSTCWEQYYGKGTAPSNITKPIKKWNGKGQVLNLRTFLSGGGSGGGASGFEPKDPLTLEPPRQCAMFTNTSNVVTTSTIANAESFFELLQSDYKQCTREAITGRRLCKMHMPKPNVVGSTNYFSLLDCDDLDDDPFSLTTAQYESLVNQQSTTGAAAADQVRSVQQPCSIPTIKFLNSWLVELVDAKGFAELVSVEEKLDGKWTKWNSNSGMVARYGKGVERNKGRPFLSPSLLSPSYFSYPVAEEDASAGRDIPTASDVPQAFSHWTFHRTAGKILVCDLQGVFENGKNQYSMSDPVIHSERKGTYGRTDRGLDGTKAFFKSHKCNAMCRKLGLTPNTGFDPSTISATTSVTGKTTSRNTSAFTVEGTNHLKLRQMQRQIPTRELQAAVKHGKKKVSRKEGGTTRIIHEHEGLEYITDKTGKVGITGYRKA